jgi:hypothetical protein
VKLGTRIPEMVGTSKKPHRFTTVKSSPPTRAKPMRAITYSSRILSMYSFALPPGAKTEAKRLFSDVGLSVVWRNSCALRLRVQCT